MVMNLSDANKNISVEQLIASIGSKYLCTPIEGPESSSQQTFQQSNGFTLVNPTDDWFPGKFVKYDWNLIGRTLGWVLLALWHVAYQDIFLWNSDYFDYVNMIINHKSLCMNERNFLKWCDRSWNNPKIRKILMIKKLSNLCTPDSDLLWQTVDCVQELFQ